MFLLVASLLLLYFLMRLMLRYIIDHPSRTFAGTLGVELMLGMIALAVIVAVLAYFSYTRPEPIEFSVAAPPVMEDIQMGTHEQLQRTTVSIPEVPVERGGDSLDVAVETLQEPDRKVLSVQALFASHSSIVNPQFHPALDAVAALMASDDSLQVEVHGYSDSRGDPITNQVLSEQRALSIARYLETDGVDTKRLEVSGHGSSDPVAAEDTASGRARNRRVEVIVIKPAVLAP
jgi:outer membrane protein OmpA-like peptidoglycan-associated protein